MCSAIIDYIFAEFDFIFSEFDFIFSELEIIIAQLDFTFSGHEFIFTVIAPLFGVGVYWTLAIMTLPLKNSPTYFAIIRRMIIFATNKT